MSRKPLIGVIADRRMVGVHPFHMAGEKYLSAVAQGAGGIPLVIPALDGAFDVGILLSRLDGLFLTGSPSNVDPKHYMGQASREGTWHDPQRDVTALQLIPAAIKAGMPLLAVCRGFQEMNVACGGTLHQHIHEVPGFRRHKENPDDPLDQQYGPSHEVEFIAGGMLESITGTSRAVVNSLHSQAVDRLGEGLRVEALADDGLVEAFVLEGTPGFNLSVQWHPEWKVTENPVSMAIFKAFGDACNEYHESVS